MIKINYPPVINRVYVHLYNNNQNNIQINVPKELDLWSTRNIYLEAGALIFVPELL